jgi:hypothetical protein
MVLLAASTPLYSQIFGILAGFVAVVGFFPYFRSIFRGETKPQRASFAIWSVVSVISLSSYIASGARATIWVGVAFTILQIVVFILSFKYGMGGFHPLDITCFVGAAISIGLWVLTENPLIALYLSIFIEVLGFIPTVKKTYRYPKTENLMSWTIGVAAAFINLFAITEFSLEVYSYPLYIFMADITMVVVIFMRRTRNKKLNPL